MDNFQDKNIIFMLSIAAFPAAIFRWYVDEIFIVNILGCFLLGFINALLITRKYKLMFGFGFCGSLTSFSGWSFKLFELINQGLYKRFFLNSISFVILGFFAVGLGHFLAKKLNA